MSIREQIDALGDYIQKAKSIPVLDTKLLDTDYLMNALQDLYQTIPEEILKAENIVKDQEEKKAEFEKNSEELMTRTKEECERLLNNAREEAKRILDQDELTNMVEEEARRIKTEVLAEVESVRKQSLADARELKQKAMLESQKVKAEAEQYADDLLNHIDTTLTELKSSVKSGRRMLSDLKEQDLLETSQ